MTFHRPALPAGVLILLLWLAGLGAAAQFAKIGVPFEEIRVMFPEAGARAGWLLSLVSLIGAVFGLVAGSLVLGIGLRRALLAALLLGGAVSLVQARMDALTPLLFSRAVEGASHLFIVIAAPTLIAQLAPDRYRNLAMTLWATFFGVTYVIVAWLGLPLIRKASLGVLFQWHGAFMLAMAALLWAVLPRVRRGEVPRLPSASGILAAQRRAYASPRIAAPGLGWLFYTLTFVSLLAILPALMPPDRRALMIAALPLISIASSLMLVPLLLRFTSAVGLIQLGFMSAALSAAAMLLPDDPSLPAMALFAALGIIQGASFAAVPVLNADLGDRALANGLMAQMGNLGNLLGTPLLMLTQLHLGGAGLIAMVVGGYVIAVLCHRWMARRRDRLALSAETRAG